MKRSIFKTVEDVEYFNMWLSPCNRQEDRHSRIFTSTKLENMIYNELRSTNDNGLNDIERIGNEKLNTFSSLIQDTFQSLYSINLRKTDEELLETNARVFNKEIMKNVLSCEDFPAFKAICEGQELPAFEAVKDFSEHIFNKLDELLNEHTDECKNLHLVLNRIEQQLEDNKEKINELLSRHKTNGLTQQEEKKLLQAAGDIISKQEQKDKLTEMIEHSVYKSKEVLQTIVTEAVASAKEKAEQAAGVLSSWGLEGSSPQAVKHNAELLQRVKNNNIIMNIAKYMGKYREVLNNEIKNSFAYGRGDKYDITLGNDYTRAVSSEYAFLALPETVPLFIQRVQRKALKQYRKRERISKGHGDVVICLDESGSTEGEPIAWGKALALTLMEAAHRYNKNCVIIRFSGIGEVYPHYFFHNNFTTEDILTFADSFLGGGTEFKGPLSKAANIIENEKFGNADVLFITDGDCCADRAFLDVFNKKKKDLKFSVTSIVLDKGTKGSVLSVNQFSDRVFKLSEMTGDEVSKTLIKKVA